MKRAADIIVRYRYIFLAVMVALTVVFGLMIPQVNINTDLTKYLADSSNMKQGIDIMNEEFQDLKTTNRIRIMFTGLDDTEKESVNRYLESIPYVDSVGYDIGDADYNKGDYTLYEIETEYDFESEEEKSIRITVDEKFAGYDYIMEQQNNTITKLPFEIIVTAVVVLLVILFVMSGSWFEPLVLVMVIGLAILLNMGTNILKPEVSQTTFAIAAILQLVLSMDYSIILMNRFRLEKEHCPDSKTAMKLALSNAFSSVTSSAVTTIVGLLMLVFMSFKIGPDLGIVMAKGVLCSLICVITVLPCLILLFEKVIDRTRKPVPKIPTGKLASGEFKARFILTPVFAALFIAALIIQGNTGFSFGMCGYSHISEVFPATNSTVILYSNDDAENIGEVADALEEDENVTTVISYDTFFAKQRTADEMADTIRDLGADVQLDTDTLKMLYYRYYSGDNLPEIKIADLLNFIADDVADNESFSEYIGEDIAGNIERLKKFTDKDVLTEKTDIDGLAEFFEMDRDDVEKLLILYYSRHSGGGTPDMTVSRFVEFLSSDVMNNPDYSSQISGDMRSQIEMLKKLSDASAVTTPYTYEQTAEMLGMDASQMKLLYVYYYALDSGYDPGRMTLPDFVTFLNRDVITDPLFASFIDESAAQQIKTLAAFTDTSKINAQMSVSEMAGVTGMTESQVNNIYSMYYGAQYADSTVMTLSQCIDFILGNEAVRSGMTGDQISQLAQVSLFVKTAESGAQLTAGQLAGMLDISEYAAAMLIQVYGISVGNPYITAVPLYDFISFINSVISRPVIGTLIDEETKSEIRQLYSLLSVAVSGREMTYSEMAQLLGMEKSEAKQIYVLYAGSYIIGKTMSPYQMTEYMLTDPSVSSQLDAESLAQMKTLKQIMDVSLSGRSLTSREMSGVLGMDESTVRMLYTLHASYGDISSWKLSVSQIVDFVLDNESLFGGMLGGRTDSLRQLQRIIDGTVSGSRYGYADMASLLGMDSGDMKKLYLLYTAEYGNTDSWGASPSEFVKFILDDVVTDRNFASEIDDDMVDSLKAADRIMDAVISDRPYTHSEAAALMKNMSDGIDGNSVKLLYTYYGSRYVFDDSRTMSVEEMFDFIYDDILNDPAFSGMIENDTKTQITDMKGILDEAVDSLKGENYSMLTVMSTYPDESQETAQYIAGIHELCDENLEYDHYIIGTSAMYYEMSQGFRSEMTFMTIITALAIFIIVMIAFRSVIIPALLVLLIQCAVFVTVSFSYFRGYDINYLAYLIVQCVLMGSTIDYAILFTNNYLENRLHGDNNSVVDSLKYSFSASIHTIMTSGLIMILLTGIVGFSSDDPSIGPICTTISLGCISAVVLIVFILPALLAVTDRFFIKRKMKKNSESQR